MNLLTFNRRKAIPPSSLKIEYPFLVEGFPSVEPGEIIKNEVSDNFHGSLSKPLPITKNTEFINRVVNGNFSDLTGWWDLYNSATLGASGNVLSVTGNGASQYVGVSQDDYYIITPGMKLFIQAKVTVKNSDCSLIEFIFTSSAGYFDPADYVGTIYNPEQNTEYLMSAIWTVPEEFGGNLMLGINSEYASAEAANGKEFEVKDFLIVEMGTDYENELFHLVEGQEYYLQWLFKDWFNGTKEFIPSDITTSRKQILLNNALISVGDTGQSFKTIQVLFRNTEEINKDFDISGLFKSSLNNGLVFGGIAGNEIVTVGDITGNYSSWEEEGKKINPGLHLIDLVWNGEYYDIYIDGSKKKVVKTGTPQILNFSDFVIGNLTGYFNNYLCYMLLSSESLSLKELKQSRKYILKKQFQKGVIPWVTGNTYYVSNSGDDDNDGLSALTPWQTLTKVNSFSFNPGDTIRFKRGDTWRGQLECQSGSYKGQVTYSCYGTGEKPIILGSIDKSASGNWTNISGNIWMVSGLDYDIGNIIFDGGEAVGKKKATSEELESQNDFWYDSDNEQLRIYSSENPAELYESIELAQKLNVIKMYSVSCITVENIDLFFGGAHGIGCTNVHDILIKNCEIGFMGGSYLSETLRYGNGIEFFDYCTDLVITKCFIHDIFDAGITIQGHDYGILYRDCLIKGNIFSNCEWSIEFWNMGLNGLSKNIRFENNNCYAAGLTWGRNQRPDSGGIHINLNDNSAKTEGVYVRGNIIDYAKTPLIYVSAIWEGIETLVLENNQYRQPIGEDSFFAYQGVNYDTLEEFQLATEQETGSSYVRY